jgi:hypothetical protein
VTAHRERYERFAARYGAIARDPHITPAGRAMCAVLSHACADEAENAPPACDDVCPPTVRTGDPVGHCPRSSRTD